VDHAACNFSVQGRGGSAVPRGGPWRRPAGPPRPRPRWMPHFQRERGPDRGRRGSVSWPQFDSW